MKSFLVSLFLLLFIIGIGFVSVFLIQRECSALVDDTYSFSLGEKEYSSKENEEKITKTWKKWQEKRKLLMWFVSDEEMEEMDRAFTRVQIARELKDYGEYVKEVRLLQMLAKRFHSHHTIHLSNII